MPTVMIVDDDRDLMIGMSAQLAAIGLDVVPAYDGVGALEKAQTESVDLILLDLGLPQMDGFEVMRKLKEIPQSAPIPIIVLSARDPIGNRRQARRLGAVGYFQKPTDPDQLRAAIEEALEARYSDSNS